MSDARDEGDAAAHRADPAAKVDETNPRRSSAAQTSLGKTGAKSRS